MRILTNAFPTNMPDSEKVSQGGPANFAKQFTKYVVSTTKHEWNGLIMSFSSRNSLQCKKIHSFRQRNYYRFLISKILIKKITRAKKKEDPQIIFKKQIGLVIELIKEIKPDVIFLNGFGITNWILLKAGERMDIPVVIQHAGVWSKELDVHRKAYTIAGISIMKKMEEDSSRIASCEIFLN
jgi:hypothetical protein